MSFRERVVAEIREIGLVTAYFLAFFLFFLSLKWLLLEQYQIETQVLGTAVVSALVVAKVVVLLDKTPVGNLFASSRRAVHVLWRSLVYTAIVFVVTLLERLIELLRGGSDFAAALGKVWAGEDLDHFLAMNLAVAFSFVVYNVLGELGEHLGEGALGRFFFGRRGVAGEG